MIRILITALVFAGCTADVEQQVHPSPRDARPASSKDLASQDRDFIERAAQGSNAEISMGKVAPARALRPEVAALGRLMVTDHTAINEQLGMIAKKKGIVLPTSLGEQQQSFDRIVDLKRETFDREFVRALIESHQQAVLLYEGEAAGGVDADVRAFASATLPKIEAHLAHAKSLAAVAAFPQQATKPPDARAVTPPSAPRERHHAPASTAPKD
jgi:putative membrane protein